MDRILAALCAALLILGIAVTTEIGFAVYYEMKAGYVAQECETNVLISDYSVNNYGK